MEEPTSEQAPEGQADVTPDSVPSVPSVETSEATPQEQDVKAEADFDPKTSYEALLKELETTKQSYGSLRKEFTHRTQTEAELKAQIKQLSEAVAKATEEEISPEDFIRSLQTHGIKALEPLKAKWLAEIQSQYDEKLTANEMKAQKLELNMAIMKRERDAVNYPDFDKLRAKMAELFDDPNSPVNLMDDPNEALDTAYKLARSYSMENAVKEAAALGKSKAEAQLKKEAATSVASSGKTGKVSDPNQIDDIAELRKFYVERIGEAE